MDYIMRELSMEELYHAGVKGMKWGVRRYQNEDGTLTDAGKKRYARDAREKGYKEYDSSTDSYKKTKKNNKDTLEIDARRYVKEDMERSKRVADDSANMAKKLSDINNRNAQRAAKEYRETHKLDLSKMTDQQLRESINRGVLERQYNDLYAPKYVDKGRQRVDRILEVAGDSLAVTSSALAIALSLKALGGW